MAGKMFGGIRHKLVIMRKHFLGLTEMGQHETVQCKFGDIQLRSASLLFGLLLLVPGVGRAQSEQLVNLLFSPSGNWNRTDSLPLFAPSQMTSSLAQTLVAPLSSGPLACLSVPILQSTAFLAHIHKFTSGGQTGLIYEGPGPCIAGFAGDQTIIWQTLAPHSMLDIKWLVQPMPLIQESSEMRGLLFTSGTAIAPHLPPSLHSSHIVANQPPDIYFDYNLIGPTSSPNIWSVPETLTLPPGIVPASGTETAVKETVLRDTPIVDNTYDPNRSGLAANGTGAIFGNIERRFLPGAQLIVFAQWRDKSGSLWQLVGAPEEADDGLCYYSRQAGVNVGWIEMHSP